MLKLAFISDKNSKKLEKKIRQQITDTIKYFGGGSATYSTLSEGWGLRGDLTVGLRPRKSSSVLSEV